MHTSVPCAVYTAQVKPARLDELTEGSIDEMAKKWQDRHIGVLQSVQEPIHVPPKRRRCHEAEECLCSGAGRLKARCEAKLKTACKDAKEKLGGRDFDSMLDTGRIFCKLSWMSDEEMSDLCSDKSLFLAIISLLHRRLVTMAWVLPLRRNYSSTSP